MLEGTRASMTVLHRKGVKVQKMPVSPSAKTFNLDLQEDDIFRSQNMTDEGERQRASCVVFKTGKSKT